MKTKIFLLILLSLFYFTSVSAQKKGSKITITGTVLDEAKNPIPNAIIMIDNEKTDVLTDANGKYKIKVKPEVTHIAIFTFGRGVKEQVISGRTVIDFDFGASKINAAPTDNVTPGQESVNVGYNYTKKKDISNETYVKDPNTKKKTYSSIYEMLQEIPGVQVHGTSVNIQDSKNLWGSIPPLFVVDGVYVDDLSYVSPTQVESVSVLKGSSAAMYGSRGYGGVVVVKTKKINTDK
jgi:TonB-dependent SusC/RagA subfamily outer membrane receptor